MNKLFKIFPLWEEEKMLDINVLKPFNQDKIEMINQGKAVIKSCDDVFAVFKFCRFHVRIFSLNSFIDLC